MCGEGTCGRECGVEIARERWVVGEDGEALLLSRGHRRVNVVEKLRENEGWWRVKMVKLISGTRLGGGERGNGVCDVASFIMRARRRQRPWTRKTAQHEGEINCKTLIVCGEARTHEEQQWWWCRCTT